MVIMTSHEACVISAYTGVLLGDFDDLHKYIEKIMGRPVFTHELANSKIVDEIRAKSRPDFMELQVQSR